MVDEMEDGEYEPKPRTLSTSNSFKNPSDLPGLFNCHSCGLYCPPKSHIDNLHLLKSMWRVVLLCNHCLGRIRSGEACSYCFFKIFNDEEVRLLRCRDCSRQIHLHCAPLERGYVTLSELDPDSFTCIDCCPILSPHRRKPPKTMNFGVSLDSLVRDASAAADKKEITASRAKERALKKVAEASCASKRARSMLGAVASGKDPALNPDRADEELALRLHLAMNGSQRILRNPRRTNSDRPVSSKKARKAESASYGSCDKVEFSSKYKALIKSVEETWSKEQKKEFDGHSESSLVEGPVKGDKESSDRSFSIRLDSNCMIDQEKGIDGCSECNLVEVPMKENQGRCNRTSLIVDSDEKIDHNKGIDGCSESSLVEILVKEEHTSCYQSSTIELDSDERMEQKNEINVYRESNLVEVPVDEEHGSCVQSSSSIESEGNEKKDQKKVVYGFNDSKLVEVIVNEERQTTSEESSSTELGLNDMKYQKGTDGPKGNNLVDIPVREENGGSFNGIDPIYVSCQRIDELNGKLVLSELRVCALKDSLELQQKKRCVSPDPYMKKCSKRNSGLKRTSSDTTYEASEAPMHSSPHTSSSRCQ